MHIGYNYISVLFYAIFIHSRHMFIHIINEKMNQEATSKGVVLGVSIGTVLTSCLVVVIIVFLVIRKRRENILKSKMREKTIQQSKDGTSIVYTTLIRSHKEYTPRHTEHEYSHIIRTNSCTDASIGRRHEDKNGGDTDHINNHMPHSISPEKNVYYSGFEVNQTHIQLRNLPDYARIKAHDSKELESDVEKLPKNPQSSMTIVQMPINAKKNRYKGLYAYDTTSVDLHPN